MRLIRIGGEAREFLAITLLGRERPGDNDYWDGNWVAAEVQVAAGGFHGVVHGSLRAEELADFHRQVCGLQVNLTGEAALETMEQWLSLRVVGQRGPVSLRGELRDRLGTDNRLSFVLELDQSYLGPFARELEQAASEFAVVGQAEPGAAADRPREWRFSGLIRQSRVSRLLSFIVRPLGFLAVAGCWGPAGIGGSAALVRLRSPGEPIAE